MHLPAMKLILFHKNTNNLRKLTRLESNAWTSPDNEAAPHIILVIDVRSNLVTRSCLAMKRASGGTKGARVTW